jgi:hypothetical protein
MTLPGAEVTSRTMNVAGPLDGAYRQLAMSMDELEQLLSGLNERLPGRGFDQISSAIQSVRQVITAARGQTPSAAEALTCAGSSLRLLQAALMECARAINADSASAGSSSPAANIVHLESFRRTK